MTSLSVLDFSNVNHMPHLKSQHTQNQKCIYLLISLGLWGFIGRALGLIMFIIRALEINRGPLFSCYKITHGQNALCNSEWEFGVQKFTQSQIKSKGPLLPALIWMPLDQASPSPDSNTFLCFRLCLDRFLKPSVSYLCGTLPEFFSSVCGLCQHRHLFLPQQQPNEVHWTWIKSNFKIFHSLEEVFRSKYFIKMT